MSDALEAAIRDAFDYRPLEGQQLYVKAEAALDALLAELREAREALREADRQLTLPAADGVIHARRVIRAALDRGKP